MNLRLRLGNVAYTFGLSSWAQDLWDADWRVSRLPHLPILKWEKPPTGKRSRVKAIATGAKTDRQLSPAAAVASRRRI